MADFIDRTDSDSYTWWYGLYLLLFPLTYLVIIADYGLARFPGAIILLWSYYLILWKGHKEPIIYLILFSRCLNGFMVPHSNFAYTIMNFLTSYLPICILLVRRLPFTTVDHVMTTLLGRYKFTALYCLALIGFMFVDLEPATYVFFPRVVPMLLFALACLILHDEIEPARLRAFFRWTFIGMLVAYLLPSYSVTARELLQDGVIFKQGVEKNQYFVLFEYFRNIGIFWDSRILGLFSYLFLYLTLRQGGRHKYLDIILAMILLMSSMSRAGIMVGFLLLFVFFVGPTEIGLFKRVLRVGAIGVIMIVAIVGVYQSPLGPYLESFSVLSEQNAISQRQGFADYAMKEFWDNPLGHGQGYLKSPSIERTVAVGDAVYNQVSDAFYAIVLGEMGIFGFLLFVLSAIEILFQRNRFAIALMVGFTLQLVGTDVPDMGMFYFVFLIIASHFGIRYESAAAPVYHNNRNPVTVQV